MLKNTRNLLFAAAIALPVGLTMQKASSALQEGVEAKVEACLEKNFRTDGKAAAGADLYCGIVTDAKTPQEEFVALSEFGNKTRNGIEMRIRELAEKDGVVGLGKTEYLSALINARDTAYAIELESLLLTHQEVVANAGMSASVKDRLSNLLADLESEMGGVEEAGEIAELENEKEQSVRPKMVPESNVGKYSISVDKSEGASFYWKVKSDLTKERCFVMEKMPENVGTYLSTIDEFIAFNDAIGARLPKSEESEKFTALQARIEAERRSAGTSYGEVDRTELKPSSIKACLAKRVSA